MAITVIDASSSLVAFLKTSAKAADTRALIQGGATNVFESGDITPVILNAAVDARRTAAAPTKVLAIDVEDGGEERQDVETRVGTVTVRIYDRDSGYRNIRAIREQVIRDTDGADYSDTLTAVDGRYAGVLSLEYLRRSGHRFSREYQVDWEALQFRTYVTIQEE
jgi:hypothetical protein